MNKTKENISEQYKVLTETSPDCIKLVDLEGNLKYINPGGLEEHKLESVEKASEKNWKISDTMIDENIPVFNKAFNDALMGKTSTIEIQHKKGTSDREFCLETIAPIKNNKGKVVAIFGVSRDITKIKKSEKELKKMKDNLEITIESRTKELNKKVEELERLNQIMVGREHKMIELKDIIKKLKEKE